jgi:ketosteroid isomerase-like protein
MTTTLRYAWFLVFSEETGKVVEIREYCDTALLQEISEMNPPPPSK